MTGPTPDALREYADSVEALMALDGSGDRMLVEAARRRFEVARAAIPATAPGAHLNPEASIESLLDLIQQEVYAGQLTLAFDGSYWNVEWVEAHPGDETFQRTAEIDGTYSDLREALLQVATMLGLPREARS